jgi:predicted esterase
MPDNLETRTHLLMALRETGQRLADILFGGFGQGGNPALPV